MSEALWYLTKDGDRTCLALYERHYSAYRYQDGRRRKLFVGPGEKIVLRTGKGDALFVWRKFIDESGTKASNYQSWSDFGERTPIEGGKGIWPINRCQDYWPTREAPET